MPSATKSWRDSLRKRAGRLSAGAQNALERVRLGRLGERYAAPYEVLHRDAVYRLRHYRARDLDPKAPVVVLVPPLMLTAEIYDLSEDLSAVGYLARAGVDAWVVDFGAPEQQEGGLERTLDDHVKAVADAIERVARYVDRPLHLAGYSQGGMFCYQALAYDKSPHVRSLITFGSPVDIHQNLPRVSAEFTEKVIDTTRALIEAPLARIEGLPGFLTSSAFKVLSLRKEIQQIAGFVRKLHDRQALVKNESRRRFLNGEGFVAWPGPAFRTFVDEFIVANRMAQGGFVVDGRTVSLADITVPILSFVGTRDDIARPEAVRGIHRAAPNAPIEEVELPAGHFGLVVGSRAMSISWPTLAQWVKWQDGRGEKPRSLLSMQDSDPMRGYDEVEQAEFDVDVRLFLDAVEETARNAMKRLGRAAREAAGTLDDVRYQIPRLTFLEQMHGETQVSMGSLLLEQATKRPEGTFFIWKGRAFTYEDANTRVDNVVSGLLQCGVRPGQRVALLMEGRPSLLSAVAAINRIGAVAVLLNPAYNLTEAQRDRLASDGVAPVPDDTESQRAMQELGRRLDASESEMLLCDPEHAAIARLSTRVDVLCLGGGPSRQSPLPAGVTDMEAIDPKAKPLPGWYSPNPGRARDLSLVLFPSSQGARARPTRVTNRRWAFSAYGAAAASSLAEKDTVYCALPLHHASGLLVCVGGALVGGARLALAREFTPTQFWRDVPQYGVTVCFYAGEMLRDLVDAPVHPAERNHPLRLVAGSGLRRDVWRRVATRFGVDVLEFYASSEGNFVLANGESKKVGWVGHPLPGSAEMRLVEYDFEHEQIRRRNGRAIDVPAHRVGLLAAKLDANSLPEIETRERIARGLFEADDAWYVTGDLMRKDAMGDYEYVDRLSQVVQTPQGPVFTPALEDLLYELPEVQLAVVHKTAGSRQVPIASLILHDPENRPLPLAALGELLGELPTYQRPAVVRVVESLPMTDGHRPLKGELFSAPVRHRYEWSDVQGRFLEADS